MKGSEVVPHSDGRSGRSTIRKQTSPSLISLFTGFTNNSASGSLSTITQESTSRSRPNNSRRIASSKAASKQRAQSKTRSKPSLKAIASTKASTVVPNVFQFLDPEQSSINLLSSTTSSAETSDAAEIPRATGTRVKDGLNQSFHSDSGISMPESSSERESTVKGERINTTSSRSKRQERSTATRRRPRTRPLRQHSRYDAPLISNGDNDYDGLPSPEAYYRRYPQQLVPGPRQLELEVVPDDAVSTLDGSSLDSGYDQLAAQLSSSAIPPVYRRFATLNHRLLLQLQDEISEMEEELRYLDDAEAECLAAEANATGRPIAPASRRMMPRSQRHQAIYYRRYEVLVRLSTKMDQYNNSLVSFHRVDRTLSAAHETDVSSYRDHLATSAFVNENDTKFLDHVSDLITLPRRANGLDTQRALAAAAAAVLLPFLSFAVIHEFFGRLLVLVFVGAGVGSYVGKDGLRVLPGMETSQDLGRASIIYFIVMTFLAMVIG